MNENIIENRFEKNLNLNPKINQDLNQNFTTIKGLENRWLQDQNPEQAYVQHNAINNLDTSSQQKLSESKEVGNITKISNPLTGSLSGSNNEWSKEVFTSSNTLSKNIKLNTIKVEGKTEAVEISKKELEENVERILTEKFKILIKYSSIGRIISKSVLSNWTASWKIHPLRLWKKVSDKYFIFDECLVEAVTSYLTRGNNFQKHLMSEFFYGLKELVVIWKIDMKNGEPDIST